MVAHRMMATVICVALRGKAMTSIRAGIPSREFATRLPNSSCRLLPAGAAGHSVEAGGVVLPEVAGAPVPPVSSSSSSCT